MRLSSDKPDVSAPEGRPSSRVRRAGRREWGDVLAGALGHIGRWNVTLYVGALALYFAVGLLLISRMPINGDEPWYVLFGYSIVHDHTVDLAPIINNPTLYHQFLSHWDDHTKDFLGNGERVLPNLPGYAAIVGICYWLAGRVGVVLLQAAATALTVLLLFHEGRRWLGSRAAGLFTSLAFVATLPALVYVAEIFPSALASCLAFLGFVLATRGLPEASGRRLIWLGAGIGAVGALLPWLHFKYALVALALLAIMLATLWPRLGEWRSWWPRGGTGGAISSAQVQARYAALLATGITALSFLLIAAYCHRYFGTWTPQYSGAAGTAMDFAHPNLPRALALYGDMFLGNQSGLLPWAPLDLLVIPGAVLLWRRDRRQALALLLCVGAQVGGFLPVLFTPAIYQGYALPSRFTVECAPFFALCVAAVFAAGLPSLRRHLAPPLAQIRSRCASMTAGAVAAWPQVANSSLHCVSGHEPGPVRRGVPRTPSDSPDRTPMPARLRSALLAGSAACASLLLLASGWLTLLGVNDPGMLFPAHGGNRIALKYPTIVPAWWFGLFPDPIHVVTSSATLALSPDVPSGATAPSPADTRVSADNDLPPGRYVATFSWSCAPTENAGGAENGSLTDLVLTIESGRGSRRSRIVEEPVPAAPCTSAPRSITVGPFGSDGYDSITFHIVHSTGVTLGAPKVTYRPA